MGMIEEMWAAVATLETRVREVKQAREPVRTHAEQVEAELEAQRQWRLASKQRHARPSKGKAERKTGIAVYQKR